MRAFVIPTPGSRTVELAEVPHPRIGPNELLVQVHAVGVGIHDSYFLPTNAHYPYPIGIEAAGVVVEVGSGARGSSPGDRVAFVSSMQPKGGTWARYAVVDSASMILPIPPQIDLVMAAAIPVAGNTVVRALSVLSEVPTDGTIFIAGGSVAIATFAIQLARQRGWRVEALAKVQTRRARGKCVLRVI